MRVANIQLLIMYGYYLYQWNYLRCYSCRYNSHSFRGVGSGGLGRLGYGGVWIRF